MRRRNQPRHLFAWTLLTLVALLLVVTLIIIWWPPLTDFAQTMYYVSALLLT